jgi:uncharacterized protein
MAGRHSMAFEVDLYGKKTLRLDSVHAHTIPTSMGWAGLVKACQYIRVSDPRGRQCTESLGLQRRGHGRAPIRDAHARLVQQALSRARRELPLQPSPPDSADDYRHLRRPRSPYRRPHRASLPALRRCWPPPQLHRQPDRGDRAYFGTTRFYVPQPFNICGNVPIGADGRVLNGPAPSKKGDYVMMKAWSDVVCAVSACPQQFDSISGWFPTEVQIDVFEPSAEQPD